MAWIMLSSLFCTSFHIADPQNLELLHRLANPNPMLKNCEGTPETKSKLIYAYQESCSQSF